MFHSHYSLSAVSVSVRQCVSARHIAVNV